MCPTPYSWPSATIEMQDTNLPQMSTLLSKLVRNHQLSELNDLTSIKLAVGQRSQFFHHLLRESQNYHPAGWQHPGPRLQLHPDIAAHPANRWCQWLYPWPGHFSHSRSDPIISPSRLLGVYLDEDTRPYARDVTADGRGQAAWLWLIIVPLSLGGWYLSMNGTKCGVKSQIINRELRIT